MTPRRNARAMALCFALALTARALRRSPEMVSSDAADLASDVTKYLCSGKPANEILQELLLFRLGGVQPLVVAAHGWLARALGFTLQPTAWEWSTILVSSAAAPLAFLAGKQWAGLGAGWAWASFLALSPIHVMLGRNLGAPWAYEISFQLALLWLADRYLSTATRSSAGPLLGTLAVYLWCGNQMLAIVPVLAYAFLSHVWQQPPQERLTYARNKLATGWLLLPVASAAALAYCTFVSRDGHLHHALFEKRKSLGWYWSNFYSDLVHNLGYVPAWVCLAALLAALFAPIPVLDRRRIPLVYALCYVLPFVFLVNRTTTLTRGYSVYGVTGLLGLVALTPCLLTRERREAWSGQVRRVAPILSLTVAACLLAASGSSVYKLYSSKTLLGVKGFQGSYVRPIGAAAAAGFVAELARKTNDARGVVFSDAYGGTGLEPPIMRLYFKRPHFAHYDAPRMAPWNAYASKASRVSYAVIKPENAPLVGQYFPHLVLAANIQDASDKTILLVFARDYEGAPRVLSVHDGVRSYSQHFPSFCEASS